MVIILDDDYDTRISLSMCLKDDKIPHITYKSAEDLITDINNQQILNADVAIIDAALSGGADGGTAIGPLRDTFPNIKIIFFSGYNLTGTKMQKRYKADYCIQRPISYTTKIKPIILKCLEKP